jgi:hypothetical protein
MAGAFCGNFLCPRGRASEQHDVDKGQQSAER